MIEKNVEISILCELYKNMLTDKQYMFLDDYYNNDLSLSEIAENNNITRQAVRDVIKQGENKLYELEEKLGSLKKQSKQEKQIACIVKKLEELTNNIENKNDKKIIKDIIQQMNKLI